MKGDNLQSKTLTGIYAGAASSVYPSLVLVNKVVWSFNVWVVSIQLSTSLTIYPTDTGGVFVTIDETALTPSVGEGFKSVLAHITAPNSIAGPPAFALPSSKVSEKSFPDCGKFVRSGSPVSLYAFANTVASGNYLFAIASIVYRNAD